MGGGQSAPSPTTNYIGFYKPDHDAMVNQSQQFQNASGVYNQQIQDASKKLVIPGQQGLDSISRSQIGFAQQDTANKLAAQQNAIRQQFGRNPGAAGVLQQQAANQSILANNGLPFQAALAQQQREAGQNNAVLQQLQTQGMVPQNQQNLLQVLTQLATLKGRQITDMTSNRYTGF